MKVVSKKFLVLGLLVVFCSAFMSMDVFISDAVAETEGGFSATKNESTQTSNETGGATTSVGSGLNIGGNACGSYKGNPFLLIACKATTTLADLRVLVYIIAGFGLIAFTFTAIFGKISFKHLAQLGFALFLVSMMAPFIEYFTGSKSTYSLKFGNFLPSTYILSEGSSNSLNKEDCGDNCLEETIQEGLDNDPLASDKLKEGINEEVNGGNGGGDGSGDNANGTGSNNAGGGSGNNGSGAGNTTGDGRKGADEKWSWSDVKGSAKAAIAAVRAGNDILQSGKYALQNLGAQKDRIKNAIKSSDGSLKGLIRAGGTIIDAGNNMADTAYRIDKNIERNTNAIGQGVEGVQTGGGNRVSNREAAAAQRAAEEAQRQAAQQAAQDAMRQRMEEDMNARLRNGQ
ncbi:MAG: hypothetical protein LBR70_00130 [Lactobacillaceae bacterium]|jgi:hypothetical protein|nr:hypothetical protein [Lactobacillaceae bacterium]